MPSVLLATCAELPAADEDAAVLDAALARHGVQSSWAVWTDPLVDWDTGLVVLRTTWDYTLRRDEFVTWVRSLPRVANEAPVVVWNTDKLYLGDLAAAGVPTVPTTFAPPGEPVTLPEQGEFVVKPSIGAGSRGAGRFTADRAEAARAHAAHLHEAGRVVMVQPYLDQVDTVGETSLIYLDGRFSHAIRKGPLLPPGIAHPVQSRSLFVEEAIEPRSPRPAELEVGNATLTVIRDRFGADQLYTRVDLLPSAGGPVVVELELTEPSLFLLHGPTDAADGDSPADRFAAAIAARL
jgi:hypothetical protein